MSSQRAKFVAGAGIICLSLLICTDVLRKYDVQYIRSTEFPNVYINTSGNSTIASLSGAPTRSDFNEEKQKSCKNNTEIENDIHYIQRNICKEEALMNYEIHHRNFLVSYPHQLLYCWIHKVASTTFTSMFSSLAGRHVKKNYYREIQILATKSDEELETIIHNKSFIKFMVVRHPFERLVSAFRDRIEDNSRFTTQAWLYGPRILAKRKLNYKEIFDTTKGLVLKVIPTFQEFIIWLISAPSTMYDAHWIRYHDQCLPCKIHYNVIIKLESLLNGEENFKNVTRLKTLGFFMKHLQETVGGRTTFKLSCDYFKDLKPNQIETLYKIYEMDFKIFGYSPNAYYKCSKYFGL